MILIFTRVELRDSESNTLIKKFEQVITIKNLIIIAQFF